MGLFGGDDAKKEAKKAQKKADEQERIRKETVKKGRAKVNESLAGFDETYFQGIVDKYVANYMPQLDKQFRFAQDRQMKAQAQRGVTNSSMAIEDQSAMAGDYNRARDDIADDGFGQGQQARNTVASKRIDLYNQVEAGMRPSDAAAGARLVGNQIDASRNYSPLGTVFSTFVDSANTVLASEAAGYGGTGLDLYGRNKKAAREVV